MSRLFSFSSSWWYPWFISKWENTVATLSSFMISSSVGMTVWVRGMALFASIISTFNRISLLDSFSVITTGDTQLVGFSTLSIMPSASSFSNSASSLGLTLNGILLWACATGVIAGSTCKSTFTPFIFPIPRNRSAYSFYRLLVIVSLLWTVFAILTTPRSPAVWKPIKGSVFVCPFVTWNVARAILVFDSTIASKIPMTFRGAEGYRSIGMHAKHSMTFSISLYRPVTS